MLAGFDWLKRCRNAPELLATAHHLSKSASLPSVDDLGPPHSALHSPCKRCWLYMRQEGKAQCPACEAIAWRAQHPGLVQAAPESVIIWGFTLPQPAPICDSPDLKPMCAGAYACDDRHFLAIVHKRQLKPWLRNLVLRHGDTLKGVLQLFPATIAGLSPGQALTWMAHHETYLPANRLFIRFYASSVHILSPRKRDRDGLLNFDISDFLGLLEMAEVFRTLMLPDQQRELFELLALKQSEETAFYWGRFLGLLDRRAKDMLTAWNIRHWPAPRLHLLRDLARYAYVDFTRTG